MADAQAPRTRYRSIVADSSRWDGFAFRPGDVVISTPPKCGTTWMQMLCALLIFDGPAFPAPLGDISPWLDMCTRPLAEVTAALAAQTHRRFIKTHTPLDGLPLHADVTYLVVGRDPRDVVISYEHHAANLDVARFLELRAAAVGNEDLAELPERRVPSEDPVERFRTFVTDETRSVAADARLGAASPRHRLAAAARSERRPLPLRRLAGRPRGGAAPPGARPRDPVLTGTRARARAGGEPGPDARAQCRRRAERVAGAWKDVRAFFRSGGTGEWRERLSAADLAAYEARVAALVGPDLAAWAHGGRLASGVDPDR